MKLEANLFWSCLRVICFCCKPALAFVACLYKLLAMKMDQSYRQTTAMYPIRAFQLLILRWNLAPTMWLTKSQVSTFTLVNLKWTHDKNPKREWNWDHLVTFGNVATTDKRTDVWSRDFIVWKINSGLWAVVWAELWKKRGWADYEQHLRTVFSLFQGQQNVLFFLKTL